MSAAEFWNMSPYLFSLKVDGFIRRESKATIYFREMFALHYNINRGEKTPPIDGKDVMLLPGESSGKSSRSAREVVTSWSLEEISDVTAKFNLDPEAYQYYLERVKENPYQGGDNSADPRCTDRDLLYSNEDVNNPAVREKYRKIREEKKNADGSQNTPTVGGVSAKS